MNTTHNIIGYMAALAFSFALLGVALIIAANVTRVT